MKAAIAIGVDRTGGGLQPLQAGTTGARRFATWAESQGFETRTILDDPDPVTASAIKSVIRGIADQQTCEQLVVFFSGHGVLSGPNAEIWLLSGAPTDPDEAVDLTASVFLARRCGIPHVVLISDACRSVATTTKMQGVRGSSIFPNLDLSTSSQIDRLFAAQPGQAALELRDLADGEQYTAVFTDRLMFALEGREPAVIRSRPPPPEFVIAPRPLKKWLAEVVPRAAANVDLKLKQKPDGIIESALEENPDRYLARVPGPPTAGTDEPDSGASEPMARLAASLLEMAPSDGPSAIDRVHDQAAPLGIEDTARVVSGAHRREHYETLCGISVDGLRIRSATIAPPRRVDLLDEAGRETLAGDGMHVRVHLRQSFEPSRLGDGASVLLEFEDGTGMCVAAFGQSTASVVVHAHRSVAVNYAPAQDSEYYPEFVGNREAIEARWALVAAAADDGVFRLDPRTAGQAGNLLRRFKAVDPTLGVYAAHAYVQVGLVDQARSVLEWIAQERGGVLPYDIVLLGREASAGAPVVLEGVAPCCPMLTQAWSLLDVSGVTLPGPVRRAERHLLPSLWTRFDAPGVEILKDAMLAGEIT